MVCFVRTRDLVEVVSLFELYAKIRYNGGWQSVISYMHTRQGSMISSIQNPLPANDERFPTMRRVGGPIRKMADDLCGRGIIGNPEADPFSRMERTFQNAAQEKSV